MHGPWTRALGLLTALGLCAASIVRGQTPTTIEAVNQDVPAAVGTTVGVSGIWLSDEDGVTLWTSIKEAGFTSPMFWHLHLHLGMPDWSDYWGSNASVKILFQTYGYSGN